MTQKMGKASGERRYDLDLLRVFACLSVVMIHVSAGFVVRGTAGADFWLGNLVDSLSRAGVPLFVMISGALMLDENYVFTRKKWLGHIGRMAAFYAVWSTVYCMIYRVIDLIIRGEKVRLPGMFAQIIAGHYHLWFVPMIIGLYLILPLLRLWVKEKNVRYVRYFLALAVASAFIVPHVLDILVHEFKVLMPVETFFENLNLQYAAGYTAYFILGWYLNRGVGHARLICALGVLGAAMTFAGTGWASVTLGMKSYPFYENATVNVLLHSAAVFVLARTWFVRPKKPGGRMQRAVGWIGRHSLGIYAVHIYVMDELMARLGWIHCAAAMPLIFVLTLGISALLSALFGKVPLLKKIV